jgi:hypothetical protein
MEHHPSDRDRDQLEGGGNHSRPHRRAGKACFLRQPRVVPDYSSGTRSGAARLADRGKSCTIGA